MNAKQKNYDKIQKYQLFTVKKNLEKHGGYGQRWLKQSFQDPAIFMHLVNLNEKLPGQVLRTLAGQHDARNTVFTQVPTPVCVCMC